MDHVETNSNLKDIAEKIVKEAIQKAMIKISNFLKSVFQNQIFCLIKGMTGEMKVEKSQQVNSPSSNMLEIEEKQNKDKGKKSFLKYLMPCFFK